MRLSNALMSYMATPETIDIEVAYALPERQVCLPMKVVVGTTARDALLASRLDREFPELDLQRCDIGVFGRVVDDDCPLSAGDRLEVYRPLNMDPRDARRRLAAQGETMGAVSRFRSARPDR